MASVIHAVEEYGVEVESARVGYEEGVRRLDVVLSGSSQDLGGLLDAVDGRGRRPRYSLGSVAA